MQALLRCTYGIFQMSTHISNTDLGVTVLLRKMDASFKGKISAQPVMLRVDGCSFPDEAAVIAKKYEAL